RTGDELLAWANQHRSNLLAKHDRSGLSRRQDGHAKRAEGSSSLTNYEDDSTWYTTVQVGTPAADYSLVLDTGSSDVWISSSSYTPADSSTFVNKSSAFDISYGSGDVAGYVASETFTIAQHTITGQTFAVATSVGSGLLDGTTDGIVGLGFSSLSVDGAQPIWQSAGETEFSFYLEEDSSTKRATSETAPGGIFTLGGANTSLYTGDINWLTVTEEAYWTVQLGGISVQGYSAGIGSLDAAAIDTGTTLLGGPDTVIAALYDQIPDSEALSSAEGYYSYPCDTNINATITFGNQQYALSSADFEVSEISSGVCLGAFFSVGSVTSRSSLNWIVGDVFLKGVYSIFSAGSTARVGFASLASGLNNGSSSTTVAQSQGTSGAVGTS
ncbi:acid protease, partial [Microstroma glucosiphilum]